MKKRTIIAVVCIAVVAASIGLFIYVNPLGLGNNTPGGNSTPDEPAELPGDPNGSNVTEGEITNPGENVPEPTFRVAPGKFYLDNNHIGDYVEGVFVPDPEGRGAYVAGESREYQIMVLNKNDHDATFSVDYRVPDWVEPGHTRPTSEVREWVWISHKRPIIPAREFLIVTIRLGMPSHATPPGDKWEFWIGIIDQSQPGGVRVEKVNRWIITMAS